MNKINSTKQTNKNNKKIKSQITDLIFILDRSGSMSGLEADTIGGFNSMIQKQKKENHGDKVFVTTILFDNRIKMIHDRVPLEEIKVMTENDLNFTFKVFKNNNIKVYNNN